MPLPEELDAFAFDGLSPDTLRHMRERAEKQVDDPSNAAATDKLLRFVTRINAELLKRNAKGLPEAQGNLEL